METVELKYKKYEAYKDSSVPWIGTMPQSWQEKRLKFIVDILKRIIGYEGPDVLSITQQGIKVKDITSGEGQLAMDYSKYQIVNEGDFAMNHMDLLTGYVDISKFDGVISPDYRVFKIKDKQVDSKYLLILFQKGYNDKIFYAYGQGVSQLGRWRFPADNFNNFRIPLPTIEEQTAIANFLDNKTAKIDTAIAQKVQLIELLKERKQIIIQNAVTKGLDSNVKMKDSGVEWIGEIPEHWEVKRLKHVVEGNLKYGANESGIEYNSDLPRYIRITDFSSEGKLNEEKKLSLTWSNGKDYLLKDGDILFARSGATVGKSYQFKTSMSHEKHYAFAGYLIRARPDELNIKSDFLMYFTNSGSFESWKSSIFNKATIENIGADKYSQLFIPIPPISQQSKIISHIETQSTKIDKAIALQQTQIEKLKEYKATLIDSAVTGKIKVS